MPPVTAERSPPDLADDRGGLAGDGRLVDRGDALDDVAVAGDELPGLDHHEVALAQRGRRRRSPRGRPTSFRGGGLLPHLAQRGRLGLAAALGHRLGEVGEEHGEPEPERSPRPVNQSGAPPAGCTIRSRSQRSGGEDAADLDHEHDRVLRDVARRSSLRRLSERRRAERSAGRTARRCFALGRPWLEDLSAEREEVLDDRAEDRARGRT